MNQWHVYEAAKRHFRATGRRISKQETRWKVPGATEEEIHEGLIEFDLAYERAFKHETELLPFEPTFEELELA